MSHQNFVKRQTWDEKVLGYIKLLYGNIRYTALPLPFPDTKSFSQSFVDYLGPTYFNLMAYEYKKTSISDQHQNSVKKCVYKYLFLELI